MQEMLTLSSIFGKEEKLDIDKRKLNELNELLKSINYITIQNHRKNKSNILKRYQANELCMTALKKTANYSFNSEARKLNIEK